MSGGKKCQSSASLSVEVAERQSTESNSLLTHGLFIFQSNAEKGGPCQF